MVFESLVVDLINKYLGQYVAKLDKSQLKIGLLGGNATLENLDIKENAFEELNLPVKVVQGHIGKLTLKIPWKHIYSEPVIAELDGLYVLVVPNSGVKYDAEKERLFKMESKLKELNRIEETKTKRNEQTKKEIDAKDSFGEKLAAQVVKNLQIIITNIHIRYEDSFTNPQRPFAAGITLANLSFQTCDINGQCIVIKDDTTREFFKSVKMDSLALYWKSQPTLFNGLTRGQMKNAMKGTISSSDNKVLEVNYLIQPISCSSMMHVHMKPETTNFTVPQLSLDLTMDQIGFGFTRNQYCDLATFLDSIDRVWTQSRFLKYRPNVPLAGNIKTWWLFPYTVILEEQVKRRRNMWSWRHIHTHRNKCRTYTDLWKLRMLDKKLSTEEQKTLQKCEEDLDLLNITLCRQQAEMKAKKEKKKLSEEKASSGWLSGWFGKSATDTTSSKNSKERDDIQNKMRNEFTQEEKAKLYQAIGYSEQIQDPDIPKEYVSLKLNVVLHKLTFLLSDESLIEKKLMKLSIHSLSADVQQRSAADALKVSLIMSSMQVTGSMHHDGVTPVLVSTQRVSQGDNLLLIDFETNPLDGSANQKINIRAEPLEIIYDSDTVNRLVKFATPPEELRLYELSNQVAASLEDVKEMTATGLRHIADQRLYTSIKVDVKPSYFILPQSGSYKKDCKMLLVDLGSIIVRSEKTSTLDSGDINKMTKDGKLDYDSIKETAYDKFQITMSTIQVLLIEQGDDWRQLRAIESSKSHILKPFGFDFRFKKCVISNDVNLPNIFINGCLPSLGINISDKALQSILDLILHVPFPQTEPLKVMPVKEEILKGMDSTPFRLTNRELTGNQVLRAAVLQPNLISKCTVNDGDDDQFYEASDHWDSNSSLLKKGDKVLSQNNLIDLDIVFVITMVELQIFEESSSTALVSQGRKEIVKLIIDEIGVTLTLKRFDMNVQAYVGSLMIVVPQFLQPNSQNAICLAQTKKHAKHENLLFAKLMIADKTSPDFVTFYKNTRHTLECNFKDLEICLHQEALLLLLNFSNSLMMIINEEEIKAAPSWSEKIGDDDGIKERNLKYNLHLDDEKKVFPLTSIMSTVTEQSKAIKEKRSIRLDAVNEAERAGMTVYIPETTITQWAVTASLHKLKISFTSEKQKDILQVSIRGMQADVKLTYLTTKVALSINDLRIQDPSERSIYKKLMWIEPDESIFSMEIVLFNQGTKTAGYELDLSKIDTMVHLEIGKVKIIFLYNFIVRIQLFLESFQSAVQKVVDKAQEYSEVAAQQVANALEEPPSSRIKLDIKIDAPVVYVPENSKATNALMIDLGSLSFSNEFQMAANTTTVMEVSNISLTNVRISRSILVESIVKYEKGILNPININVKMLRNLSWSSFKNIPQIDVGVNMNSLSVTMTQGDFTMVQIVLQSNFGEIVSETAYSNAELVKVNLQKTNIKDDKVRSTESSLVQLPELVTIAFSFEMNCMELELFKGDSSPDHWNIKIPSERHLTKMTCDNFRVQGKMYLNTAMEVDVRLNNIKLFDTQPGSASKINELIKARSNEKKDFISIKYMQDRTSNRKLVMDISGIYICVCVEYLMQVADFFIKSQPVPDPNTQKLTIKDHDDKATNIKNKPQQVIVETRLGDLEIDIHLERPEILLVENIEDPESNAIIVQMEVILKYALLKECDIINAEVKDFQAMFCPFNEKKRNKYSMDIISPTNLAFYCNRPNNDGMQGSLTMEHLVINITPAVIQNVSKIVNSLNTSNKGDDVSAAEKASIQSVEWQENNSFWDLKKFEDSDFSFISKGLINKSKTVDSETIEEYGIDVAQMMENVEQKRADQIFIRLPDIRVVLESELTKKTVPMLILESSVDGDMKNPLTQLSIALNISLSVSYFNDVINIWEPLIEVYPEEVNRQYCFEVQYITSDDSQLMVDDDFEDLSSRVSILMISRDSLELTLTKTALDVITNLGKAFGDAYTLNIEDHKSVVGAPYAIKNTCGLDVVLYLSEDFDLKRCMADKDKKIILKINEELQLRDSKMEKTLITEEKKARLIQIGLIESPIFKENLSISKSEIRGLCLLKPNPTKTQLKSTKYNSHDLDTLVVEITAYLGMKNIDFRSVLQVFNNSEDHLDLYYKCLSETGTELILIENVKSRCSYNVPIPILKQSDGYIYLNAPNLKTNLSTIGALWKIGNESRDLVSNQVIECMSESGVTYFYSVNVTDSTIPKTSTNIDECIRTYKIIISPPLSIHNQLPIPISCQSQIFSNKVQPGCKDFIRTVSIEKQSLLKITYEYDKKDWFGVFDIRSKMDELSVITFKARDGYSEITMDLGLHIIYNEGQVSLTLYSPYWMINKTGHILTYRAGDDFQVQHDSDNHNAVLFSFLSKSLFKKQNTSSSQYSLQSLQSDDSSVGIISKMDQTDVVSNSNKFAKTVKAYLRIGESSWSDKFSLDTVGSNGKVICKKKPISYEIGVKINLSSSGLTKIVTFMPYYMIINKSSIRLLCNELSDSECWISVPPGEAVPFWPRSEVGKSMLMCCKVDDTEVFVTQPFPFFESHSILMKLEKKYIGIFVEVQINEEANLITLQLYQDGMMLVQLVNHLGDNINICYKQSGCNQEIILPSRRSIMYSWQDSRQKKEFIWRVEGDKKQYVNTLVLDEIKEFFVNEMKAYSVSFISDMNRTLLFTNDMHVARSALISTDLESTDMEITISLHSIGLSLVDNSQLQELAYISITSSGIKWNQVRKNKRQRPLKVAQSEALEIVYDDYINKLRVGEISSEPHIVKIEDLEVDLSKKRMIKPDKCELVRVFEPGIFFQYRISPHKMHLYLRVYKIQIDNQMDDCNFTVVFAPFPLPRSVTLNEGIRPLIEMSVVIERTGDTGNLRFKYFKILIQEMQVMLDQGFVNALLDFFSSTVLNLDEEDMFKNDCKMIKDRLIDTPTINSILQGGKKCVFDNFHISPVKIHLSFSLCQVSQTGKTALHSEVLNLFLQSVGIAITDMQDVIFKLGYFEKQNCIMPISQMVGAMTSYYVSQALRQMYVLVLGLDVLGNPFGVIRGMAQGVEDLFYEPVRGAIIGPEEFAEGVAFGVKSLFGHAVGGAAGAVSRIVGTMGKGIAALTLDSDYQRKRREQMTRRPDNLGAGLAQGGRGLLSGIMHGVTGVVTKPIDGARKEGVEGFFKGVGKGLVGVVTRPVSGVVDFASSSFEGIRRVADTNVEVFRIRPPRCISKDGIIQCYVLREAEGIAIWKKVNEKGDALINEDYIFHVYCKHKKIVLLLTNLRILHLDRNEILGIWSVQWQLLYGQLDGSPIVNETKGVIVFTLKEKQRKLFSKDNITKEIEGDVPCLKVVVTKIIEIVKKGQENKTTVIS